MLTCSIFTCMVHNENYCLLSVTDVTVLVKNSVIIYSSEQQLEVTTITFPFS